MKESSTISFNSDQETTPHSKHPKKVPCESLTRKVSFQKAPLGKFYKPIKIPPYMVYFVLFALAQNALFYISFVKLIGVAGTESISPVFASIALPLSCFSILFVIAFTSCCGSDFVRGLFLSLLLFELWAFCTSVVIFGSLASASPDSVKNIGATGSFYMIIFGNFGFLCIWLIFYNIYNKMK